MQITLSPQRRDDNLTVSKQGETLTINGVEYDFSGVSDGATLPKAATDCEWLASDVRRVDGVLHWTLALPNAVDASEAARFPDPLVDPADGALPLPDQKPSKYKSKAGAIDWQALVLPLTADEMLETEIAQAIEEELAEREAKRLADVRASIAEKYKQAKTIEGVASLRLSGKVQARK
jgi:hypothetical protein